jgi:hypothetical protein
MTAPGRNYRSALFVIQPTRPHPGLLVPRPSRRSSLALTAKLIVAGCVLCALVVLVIGIGRST